MTTELDEVYIAHVKSIFPEFDDEIIWTSIFEYGYNEKGEYNSENTINYLLELSENKLDIIDTMEKQQESTTTIINNNEIKQESTINKIIESIPNLFTYGEVKYDKLPNND